MPSSPQTRPNRGANPSPTEARYHYKVIERAIAEIDQAATKGQPLTLKALAQSMGMSPAHFQRLFSQWVGVSPKRYHQYLTLGHARSLLAGQTTIFETAQTLGLSGGGRLHDLFVTWEAMTPGSYARAGAGLVIACGRFESPFGPVIAMGTAKGLCGLAFAAQMGEAAAREDLRLRWPQADFVEDTAALEPWLCRAFGTHPAPPLHLIGAPFQIKVWEALLHVPPGAATSYGEIARAIGSPKAVRAVGTAVGRNPVGFLVPCHRALRKNGTLGGYHWGLGVKRAILAWETARHEAD